MTNPLIRIFIVDDHTLMRDGMASLLGSVDGLTVVGAASSGEEAINMLGEMKADIILMDIMLKGMTGIEATRWIKESTPDVKIILLSMEVKKEFLSAGIQCGIDGYVAKDIDKDTLIKAIRSVSEGNKFFTEAITKLVFEEFYMHEKLKGPDKVKLPNELTKREFEILGLVAAGKSNKELAESLFISVKTVETHKTHILEKLGLKNTAELVKYAIKHGIVPL